MITKTVCVMTSENVRDRLYNLKRKHKEKSISALLEKALPHLETMEKI